MSLDSAGERGSYIPAPGPAPITNKDGYLLDRAIKNVLKVQVFYITNIYSPISAIKRNICLAPRVTTCSISNFGWD